MSTCSLDRGAHGARALLWTILLCGLAALVLAPAAKATTNPICRVTTTGSTGTDGSNWTDKAMDLQTALGNSACTEIWVAGGVYVPTTVMPLDQTISFDIRPDVAVYGGFAGVATETQRSDRAPATNVTILSGDIDGNDTGSNPIDETTVDIQGSNSYHVVLMDGTTPAGKITASTVLDGLTISGGDAGGSTYAEHAGGGLYCNGEGSGHACSPTLSNVAFSGNRASYFGGAMFNHGKNGGISSPTLVNVTFSGNTVTNGDGGALFDYGVSGGNSSPTLNNVTFTGNSASNGDGGAMGSFGTSSPVLRNVTFNNNIAGGSNGGPGHGGAMVNNAGCDGPSIPTLSNVIMWNDQAPGGEPEIFNIGATPIIDHSVIQGGCAAGEGNNCSNVINVDPKLPASLANNGGSTQTLLPGTGSSAIDAGNPTTCPNTDQRGVGRPQGAACDIGAVEAVFDRSGAGACKVDASKTAPGDGLSWGSAYPDLQSALRDYSCNEIWVAAGLYKPTASTDRTISFAVRPGVAVYGGFAGTESQRGDRHPATNVTILSGDIDGDDINTDANHIDETSADIVGNNSYHVLTMDGTTSAGTITPSTLLDGFTISGGHANYGSDPAAILGGGLYCNGSGSGNECSPTVSNATFSGNSAAESGGAMYNDGANSGTSSPILSNVTFSGNSAVDKGGAIYNDGATSGTSSPTVSNVTFSGNSAHDGGAMYNGGETGGTSSPALTNVTFSGNSSTRHGSAMFNISWNSSASSPTLSNVIAWGDSSTSGAPEIYNAYATPTIDHSVIQGGCTTGDGNICTNVITTDPKLPASLAGNGGSTQTLLPGAGSSAIDAGDDATCNSAPVSGLDQRGVTRPQGPHCDIGAVELVQYALNISVTGSGSVSASASPSPLSSEVTNCTAAGGPTCAAAYAPNASVTLTASADANQHFVTWGGDCSTSGNATSASVTMDAAKTCSASFAINTHTVGGSVSGLAGSGLALQLNGSETLPVSSNGSFAFTTALDYGTLYTVTVASQPSGPAQTCTISNASGNVPDADVNSVAVTCATNTHVVTGSVGTGQGSITPPTQSVADGGSATLSVTAATGWHIHSVAGCSGSESGGTFTTGAITADCTITANFAINSFAVSAAISGGHGTISPTSITPGYGDTPTFTLTPDAHYHVASVTGCGGTLSGNSYTTAPITGACTVSVTFAQTLAPYVPVPTLDRRMLLLLAGLLGAFAALRLRRG